MRAKRRAPEPAAIGDAEVRSIFLSIGGAMAAQRGLADEWLFLASTTYSVSKQVRSALDRLAGSIEELNDAILSLRPGLGLDLIAARLTKHEYATIIEGIGPQDDAPMPPRRPDWGALGRVLRSVARKARADLPAKTRDEKADDLVQLIAISWREATGKWPGFSWDKARPGQLDGPFVRHMYAIFDAAAAKRPKRSVVERVLASLRGADLWCNADGQVAVFFPQKSPVKNATRKRR